MSGSNTAHSSPDPQSLAVCEFNIIMLLCLVTVTTMTPTLPQSYHQCLEPRPFKILLRQLMQLVEHIASDTNVHIPWNDPELSSWQFCHIKYFHNTNTENK